MVIVELLKNLAKIAEGALHLADWLATLELYFAMYHVITILKLTKRLNDFGAFDGLISITIAFSEEVVQNPWTKILLTILFALFMAMREQRAKLQRNQTAPDVATSTITWILNNNRSAPRLPDHCTPISVDYASFLQLLLLSPPTPPHNVAPPPMNLLGIPKFY
ncbi:hypothetical protein YC2023_032608 [Brassica napus]